MFTKACDGVEEKVHPKGKEFLSFVEKGETF